jgi:hypothetical protein
MVRLNDNFAARYLLLYSQGYGGFACGDGWYNIIDALSVVLQDLIRAIPENEDRKNYYAVQVKEKFGGLRYYMSQLTAEMSAAISVAEALSVSTCEVCGSPGTNKHNIRGWVRTLCPTCLALEQQQQ